MEIACGGVVELNARLRNAISDIEYLKLRDVSNTRYCNNIFDEIALTLDALTDKVLPMSAKPISDLRRRMLEDMAVRKFGEKTRHDYIRHVETFASFLGRSPDTATAEDVRRYQVHLTESGVQPPTRNSSASALRFFFGTTLDRAKLARHLARVHYPEEAAACARRRRRRWVAFWKQHPAPSSSTRRR